MATILNRTTTFATNGTVTAAGLHNLIDDTAIYAGLITTQTELTTVGTADQLLIAVGGVSDTGAPRRATVQNLFDDALSVGTYTGLNLSGALTYGTATGNNTVSTTATISTATITRLTAGTTTGTAGIFTSGTIGNLSTTLAGDFTISQGTGTLGTTGATLGTYGGTTSIPVLAIDAKGRITTASTSAITSNTGFRNRIINGDMRIDQRNAGASQTFTAAAALAYSVDRFYGYCTGANVTGQRVAGTTSNEFAYRFTGAASVTAIGFGTRLEATNTIDLAGSTATLSVQLANSLLTTVTWTAFYATTADAFGTLASPTRTQIATGTFTVTSTLTTYSAQISIPSAATTGIEIVFTVGAQTSGTWTIDNVQLEAGSTATEFERRPIGTELQLCQRYFEKSYNIGTVAGTSTNTNKGSFVTATGNIFWRWTQNYRVSKRADSTFTIYSTTGASGSVRLSNASDLAVSTEDAGENATAIYVSRNATVGDFFWWQWTASAEL
jgi:hypothetical protein